MAETMTDVSKGNPDRDFRYMILSESVEGVWLPVAGTKWHICRNAPRRNYSDRLLAVLNVANWPVLMQLASNDMRLSTAEKAKRHSVLTWWRWLSFKQRMRSGAEMASCWETASCPDALSFSGTGTYSRTELCTGWEQGLDWLRIRDRYQRRRSQKTQTCICREQRHHMQL